MELYLILLTIVTLVLVAVVVHRSRKSSDASAGLMMMQQQLESLRSDIRESVQHLTENVNQQLANVTTQLQSQSSTVGNRLDAASRVIGDVQRNLGALGRATEEIKQLGRNVSNLQELLSAPKLRGGLGEYMLEDLLHQVLPAEHYSMQYRFRSGDIVDAIIRTSVSMVPVDSKFPLENFRRMLGTQADHERKTIQKLFIADVKKHIDAIASKYILPDEGTFPFALMYIPAENIYYEIIIKDEMVTDGGLFEYALKRKVIPVSPNSFYAYLQVIALGLHGLSIEQRAREIVESISRLEGDIHKVREVFDVLGVHLENARKKYDDAEKRLTNFEAKLENVTGLQHVDGGVQERLGAHVNE